MAHVIAGKNRRERLQLCNGRPGGGGCHSAGALAAPAGALAGRGHGCTRASPVADGRCSSLVQLNGFPVLWAGGGDQASAAGNNACSRPPPPVGQRARRQRHGPCAPRQPCRRPAPAPASDQLQHTCATFQGAPPVPARVAAWPRSRGPQLSGSPAGTLVADPRHIQPCKRASGLVGRKRVPRRNRGACARRPSSAMESHELLACWGGGSGAGASAPSSGERGPAEGARAAAIAHKCAGGPPAASRPSRGGRRLSDNYLVNPAKRASRPAFCFA